MMVALLRVVLPPARLALQGISTVAISSASLELPTRQAQNKEGTLDSDLCTWPVSSHAHAWLQSTLDTESFVTVAAPSTATPPQHAIRKFTGRTQTQTVATRVDITAASPVGGLGQ